MSGVSGYRHPNFTPVKTESKAAVIQLDHPGELDVFPAYVAVYSSRQIDQPFMLSPLAMQWSDSVILNRIKDCETFWRDRLENMQCDIETLFSSILSHYYDDDYIAVFASHPWQCLLFLAYQRHQEATGVYFLQSRLSQHLYRTLPWLYWFEHQSQLCVHLESVNARGFNPGRFRSRQERLKAFVNRVGLKGPFDLQQADFQSFSRRFEIWLGKIWRWTMTESSDLQGFPWIAVQASRHPTVTRDLEYPVNVWQVVEGLLREDMSRLSERFMQNNQVHVNHMRWQVRLFNHQIIEIDLRFRFPYSLHHDQPEFNTALYQARYGYDDMMRQLLAREHDLDLPEVMPLISWRIELCESFNLPPLIWDLFGKSDAEISHQNLFELQNKLPVTIESYDYANSFFPEHSFQFLALNHQRDTTLDSPQWSTQSIYRPLFYYPSAHAIDKPEAGEFIFLERTACDWWRQQGCQAINRDYFCLKDAAGRLSWVYRDFNGLWFKQGEYC